MFRNKSCFPSDFFQSNEALLKNINSIANDENKNINDINSSKPKIPKNPQSKPLRKNNSVHNLNSNGTLETPRFIPGIAQNLTNLKGQKSAQNTDEEPSKIQNLARHPNHRDFKKLPCFEESPRMPSLKINLNPDAMIYKDYPSYSSSTTNSNINKEQQVLSIDSSKIDKLRSSLLSYYEMQNQNMMINLKTLSKKELKNMINVHTNKSNNFRKDSQQNISNSDIGSPVSPYISLNKKNKPLFFPSEITQSSEKNDENKISYVASSAGQSTGITESRNSPSELLSPFKLNLGKISNGNAIQSVSDPSSRSNCNENTFYTLKLNEEIKAKMAADPNIEMLKKKVNRTRNLSENVHSNTKTGNNIYSY